MALDGLVIRAIVHELKSCIGGRINKIHQPSEHDIIMQIRAQSQNYKLILSANPTYPRIHMTRQNFINPLEAPMFCMLLRKHCESGIIESIEQVEAERIIHMDIRQRDELGDISVKRIVIEMMGRHSNIILLDPANGQILDGIHHVTPAISSFRVVLPGSRYTSPPDQGKRIPFEVSRDDFLSIMSEAEYAHDHSQTGRGMAHLIAQKIVQHFSGMSPVAARQIVHASDAASETERIGISEYTALLESVWPSFAETMRQISRHEYAPNIVETAQGKAYFSVIPLTHLHGNVRTFPSVSECLEAYYGDKAERDTIKQRVSDLLRVLQNEKAKNEKKLGKLAETIKEAKEADQHRILGELLTASLHQAKRGDKQIEVINYYDEAQNQIVIPLDPQLSPSENAQRYFKKYNKMKNSVPMVEEQMANTRTEIEYIEAIQQQLNTASFTDIVEIRDELIEQGYIRNRSKKPRIRKKHDKPALSCFTSSEGIPIYVGKNNTQNEYLSNRLAGSSDTWLHTKDIPGSHVVIKSTAFGDTTLEEAAQLAAYFSQARESSQVPVDYTLIRHVRKPSGAKPGYVIYDHQKTVFVTPDEQRIKALKVTLK
jgi:predicted ribosome quality control (RQC) complex YloA/Tae2 family protein